MIVFKKEEKRMVYAVFRGKELIGLYSSAEKAEEAIRKKKIGEAKIRVLKVDDIDVDNTSYIKAFTVSKGEIFQGIRLTNGYIHVGEEGRGRRLVRVPLPENSIIEGEKLMGATAKTAAAAAAVVYIEDHSGFRGSWDLTYPRTDEEWESIVQGRGEEVPKRKIAEPRRMIAKGRKAQGAAGYAGGGEEYLLIMQEGDAYEIVRYGRLYGAPSVIKIQVKNGQLIATDPREEAASRVAKSKWGLLGEALIEACGGEDKVSRMFGKDG
jgi:hypothetical protein